MFTQVLAGPMERNDWALLQTNFVPFSEMWIISFEYEIATLFGSANCSPNMYLAIWCEDLAARVFAQVPAGPIKTHEWAPLRRPIVVPCPEMWILIIV